MCAGSKISGWGLAEDRHVKTVLCQLFQFVFDSAQCPRGVAREYLRIIKSIEDTYDQNLTSLQIALNGQKARPDFAQSFQRSEGVPNRLGYGRPDNMEQTGGVWSTSADMRWLKTAKGIQNKKRFAAFC